MWRQVRLGVLGVGLGLAACATDPGVTRVGDTIQGAGTVLYVPLGGGFYEIEGEDGKSYFPLELDEAFQRDHLRVRFTAKLRPDILAQLVTEGELVEILSIERAWPHPPTP